MSDFETMPVGSRERLEALEAYARKAGDALARMAAGGRYEMGTVYVAGEHFPDPLFCEARVETRIRNASLRRGPPRREK